VIGRQDIFFKGKKMKTQLEMLEFSAGSPVPLCPPPKKKSNPRKKKKKTGSISLMKMS